MNWHYWTKMATSCRSMLAVIVLGLSGCETREPTETMPDRLTSIKMQVDLLRSEVIGFCGGCHAVPDPGAFPKNAWHHEVEKAYRFFHESGREDLVAPPMNAVVQWFRLQAPDALVIPATSSTRSPLRFRRESIAYETSTSSVPSISDVLCLAGGTLNATESVRPSVLFCDMRNGYLGDGIAVKNAANLALRRLPGLHNPAHIEIADLDSNQREDYVISELGSYQPGDHNQGKVVWYRPDVAGLEQLTVLSDGFGRVADARPADFDGDGDQDLVLAEFGWMKTGGIYLLEQTTLVDGIPQFRPQVIDNRHGAIHVPVADLDQDGDIDFVALISQEYEEITAYLNRGDGTFERRIIQPGGDPAYGSSGIELVDLDGDGDLDVLYVNGDSLDSDLIKPYHGVQWLENEGDYPFRHHRIDQVPGACRAVAGDLDADGDLDIVVGAWIPPKNSCPSSDADGMFDALVWFERTISGQFRRHSLARVSCFGCMAADLGDLDGDGRLDIAAGMFGTQGAESTSGLELYWNVGSDADPPAH